MVQIAPLDQQSVCAAAFHTQTHTPPSPGVLHTIHQTNVFTAASLQIHCVNEGAVAQRPPPPILYISTEKVMTYRVSELRSPVSVHWTELKQTIIVVGFGGFV